MKNTSIRLRILTGIVLINLIGAIIVVTYMHQSAATGLDVWGQESLSVGSAAWEQVNKVGGDELGSPTTPKGAIGYLEAMKKISGAEYGLLLDKTGLDQKAYDKALEAAGQPSNWSERETYALVASTNPAAAEKMQLTTEPGSVPEIGKIVGIENGACTAICHRSLKGEGDFWKVSWSTDGSSRAHAVFPVTDAKGAPIGVVYSIDDVTPQANAAKTGVYSTMIVILVTLFVATLVIGGLMDALVFKRLNKMIATMEDLSVRVAGGDFDAKFVPDTANDEIGRFEQFFAKFLDLMTSTLRALVGK